MATVEPPNPLPPDENVGPALLGVSVVTILGIIRFGVQVAQVAIGNGRHRWYIDAEDYMRNNMLGWFAQILLFASICLLKISILLLLLRIKDSQRVKYAAWGIMAGLFITNFGCIFILLAECRPISAYWTGVGNCWDARVRIYYIYATIGSSFDAATNVDSSATGFGIGRASSLGVVTSDLSWVYAITAIWSNLELYLGIVGANLALGRSMYGYFFKERDHSKVGSSYGYGNGPRSTSTSGNLRIPNSGAFRSGQTRLPSHGRDSEISLVDQTKKQEPSTWYADGNTDDDNPPGVTEHDIGIGR
ncbi:hypothetical protein FGSG_03627 [Fusarium graminearum PH-1]|uniref:hypothetical protein n=1 Tax=Gibberella zeae (strain ATCC MYA-4620 / CBS 123657 / FGSC 9075 / NRRL 31084 / PH-1) TaxID=229533 RepID=UPI000023DBA3|nr:hypothetical protein FGSG_03627 [Fusarium graminearum PH-1]ESU09574.1 hypothetical protein FGSG_03627 [Fusarium graminearum PH-1]|eukprot:XP_011322073.1 hypothetical protein FGSG_03627 [Fusarium graminearum PH-1]